MLRIAPTLVTGAGEPLDSIARSRLMEAFNAPVYMNYGATEAPYMAFDCPYGKLHLNVDWYILEPVDRDFEPVPPDQPSHTVLITNLATGCSRLSATTSATASPRYRDLVRVAAHYRSSRSLGGLTTC